MQLYCTPQLSGHIVSFLPQQEYAQHDSTSLPPNCPELFEIYIWHSGAFAFSMAWNYMPRQPDYESSSLFQEKAAQQNRIHQDVGGQVQW